MSDPFVLLLRFSLTRTCSRNGRLQLASIPLLDPAHAHEEKVALQKHFKHKRDHMLKRLARLGLKVSVPPQATFYIWLNLEHLPAPLNNGLVSFY